MPPPVPVTLIVPTFNERGDVAELVARAEAALEGREAEILFVDDSTDGTEQEVARVAAEAGIPVRVIHREANTGGLGGAVVRGLAEARHEVCIVMDGDLQHPPELLPELIERHEQGGADVIAASRYLRGGGTAGLGTAARFALSRGATWLTRAMFPLRLWRCTDPMTGFFLVDRARLDLSALRPRGFKILLEILVRSDLGIAEVPMEFGERRHGTSKASLRQGATFLAHLARLRFGKMSLFALVGLFGAVVNVGIMWLLMALGVDYIWAAIAGAEITIIGNFALLEWIVFRDMRERAARFWVRFAASFAFNNVEAALRIPLLAFMVESWRWPAVIAAIVSLAVAFFVRFLFHALVVYAPRKRAPRRRAPGRPAPGKQQAQRTRQAPGRVRSGE